MQKIYEITAVRARQIKLAKLRQILSELANRSAIPPADIPAEELRDLPVSFLRKIDDLILSELDDLLHGRMKFCLLKNM